MIVSVSGFNYSGSSAVIDLLKEFEGTEYINSEIGFLYMPDGIIDLYNSINNSAVYFCGDSAINRFLNYVKKEEIPKKNRKAFIELCNWYCKEIEDVSWKGESYFDAFRKNGISYLIHKAKKDFCSLIYHFFKKSIHLNERIMRLSFKNENFVNITRAFFCKFEKLLLSESDCDYLVLNQFVSAFDPLLCHNFLDNTKSIIVDRDPRDIYILGHTHRETTCFPAKNAQEFIKWYKKCHPESKYNNSSNVLHIYFEDLVYDYENTKNKIVEFLGLKKHVEPKKYLKPETSINNTQLKWKVSNLTEDIMLIEQELSEFLYDFKYVKKDNNKYF